MNQPAPRTLGVFAHPDDETLSGGPLLATMARRGHVTVVTATRGERGEVIGSHLHHLTGDRAALGRYRAGEITGALDGLGVGEHHFLDQLPGLLAHRPEHYTDSGMQWPEGRTGVRAIPADDVDEAAFSRADTEASARVLAALIRTETPDLVVTEEPDGGYGHPDHIQAHRVTMRAVELAATAEIEALAADDPTIGTRPWRVPVVAWVVRPAGRVRGALAWLAAHAGRATVSEHTGGPLQVLAGEQVLPTIVRPDEQVDLDVPLPEAALTGLARAMTAHATQIQAVSVDAALVADSGGHAAGWFALSNDLLQPVPARVTAMIAPGWGDREQLRALVGAHTRAAHDDEGSVAYDGARGSAEVSGADDEGGNEPDPRWYSAFMYTMTALLGVLVGSIGTVFHRWQVPFGLLLALLVVFTGSVLARALVDRRGQVTYTAVVFIVVVAMTYLGTADVIVTGEAVGVAWLLGAPVVAVLGALTPRGWFRD